MRRQASSRKRGLGLRTPSMHRKKRASCGRRARWKRRKSRRASRWRKIASIASRRSSSRPREEMRAASSPGDVADTGLREETGIFRQQREALGPVNELASEDHEETTKRLDFLATQHTDLADAKQSLQQAIREIDATARNL